MKIAPSIKIFVLFSMLMTGITIIWGLSVLSNYYFISGMEISMRNSMFAFAQQQTGENELSFQGTAEAVDAPTDRIITYSLVKDWENVPVIFQQEYKVDELSLNTLYKHLEIPSLIERPKTGSFMMKIIKDHEEYYVSLVISKTDSNLKNLSNISHAVVITVTGLLVITLFALILFFVMRQITLPVTRLKNWAKNLNNEQLLQPTPDFHYSELNTLATLIRNSLTSVQESLAREKKFLGYASHELRTPIATSRSNTELLEKLIAADAPKDKQLTVLARILRANVNMTDLTETLLWLNRSEDKKLVAQKFNLGELTKQLVSELNYLTIDKTVDVSVETDNTVCELPESVCRIIIANLVRNALQHTSEGFVVIKQSGYQIAIINQNNADETTDNTLRQDNLGFGLGLSLTKRIVQQYQWQYSTQDIAGGKDVLVVFNRNANNDRAQVN
ncbi:HAMP domain-containing sensor histidine kinase [Colwellia sp. E2M01]|uniref:sensor histidine kinase n=1 Tax=Colwellia sp. E2M01 TaxID=2841561 RepID=UPI001C09CBED|nr:HAMP domain-containing sensor histidine kinase [Colwellia sp. E2M01]MBU2869577.1 HAMP domain-containing histidine kinase [Colwellia sp. E2M01]